MIFDQPDKAAAVGQRGFKLKKELQRLAVFADRARKRVAFDPKAIDRAGASDLGQPCLDLPAAVKILESPTKGQQIAPVAVLKDHVGDSRIIFSFEEFIEPG